MQKLSRVVVAAVRWSIAANLAVLAGYGSPLQHPSGHTTAIIGPDAQREFKRGLESYYAFDYEAAIASFERAAQFDPEAAMPHWGIALSLGPNLNDMSMGGRMTKAYAAAQRAVGLAQNKTAWERDYAIALAVRYTASSEFDLDSLNRTYSRAMKELLLKYSQDEEVATLYAESVMLVSATQGPHGHARAGMDEAVKAVESVQACNPCHAGANHYHIHLLESSATPERALPSARRLETLVPDPGHLLHMPSHIYTRLGDYRAAVASNLRAVAADRAYSQKTGREAPLAGHTREFLAAAASMTGQSKLAREADDNLFVQLRFLR